jgi:hypothetical protein
LIVFILILALLTGYLGFFRKSPLFSKYILIYQILQSGILCLFTDYRISCCDENAMILSMIYSIILHLSIIQTLVSLNYSNKINTTNQNYLKNPKLWVSILLFMTLSKSVAIGASFFALIHSLLVFRFIIFTVLLVHFLKFERRWAYFLLIVDVLLEFGSFFSDFKTPMIIFILVGIHLRIFSKVKLVLFLITTVTLLLCWQLIKEDFRGNISAEENTQKVSKGYLDRLTDAWMVVETLSPSKTELKDIFLNTIVGRVSYHEYFSVYLVSNNNYHPHFYISPKLFSNLVPRILNSAKRKNDDSELTNDITGIGVAGSAEGASISPGQPLEAFYELSYLYFTLPMLLGIFVGISVYVITLIAKNYTFSVLTLFGILIAPLETSIVKLIPFIITFLFLLYLIKISWLFLSKLLQIS